MTSSRDIILSNFAPSDHFRTGSFVDQLHEQSVWDEAAYWRLDKALYDCHQPGKFSGGDESLIWPVFRIYSYLNVLLRAHVHPADGFVIRDMTEEDFHDWCERFQLTFEGFMKGHMLDNDAFEKINPLI